MKHLLSSIVLLVFTAISYCAPAQSRPEFLNPPRLVENPENYYKYSADSRKFTGISSMAVSPNGRLWVTWYAGITPGEDQNNYVTVATSGDNGASWEEVLVIDPDGKGPVRTFDPEIWIDPNGKLWVFWAQGISGKIQVAHDGYIAGVWAITAGNAEEQHPEWSAPRRITDGVLMCKPTVLSNGDWALPVSTWFLTDNSARMIVSTDQGKSFSIRGACHVPADIRTFDEHMIVERNDQSLWMLVRTKAGIGESISKDAGRTWSPLSPSKIEHPSARFFIRRLSSGNLLLVKHGPVSVKTERSHLMAFVSKDDGKSWSKGLLLDERAGVSYPDGQQTKDRKIYITYDYSRTREQMVFVTSFTEDDIISEQRDEKIMTVYRSRKLVSQGGR